MTEPTASNYPTSLDDNASLGGDQVDFKQLTLDTLLTDSATTVSVSDSLVGISAPVYLLINSELIYAPTISSGDFVSCVRGCSGTTAAQHASGETAYIVYAANLFNQLKRAVIAIETALGAALANVNTALNSFTSKSTPADADLMLLADSTSSFTNMKITWSEIKTALKTYFDTLYATASNTLTFTNKRITQRITSIVSNANPTFNTDDCDVVDITAQAADIASMTTNMTGTPTSRQKLLVCIKDDGTARAITWGAGFVSKGTALPTSTTAGKLLTVAFLYSSVSSVWGCVGINQEP